MCAGSWPRTATGTTSAEPTRRGPWQPTAFLLPCTPPTRRAHMVPNGYQALRFRYLDDAVALARHDALIMENLSGELAADRALNGGEQISLGGDVTIEVIHTPGHSPGSVSFVLSGLDWAFTGDSVQVCGSPGVPLYVDPVAYAASQKL
ncbi:MAG: MBL fold metallo-hydrolase, partial [Chloroflexi bacterium]